MNNALKQAGWKGNYYPELDELEDYTEDQLRRFHEKAVRFGRELRRTRRNKPDFTRRFREALGLAVSEWCSRIIDCHDQCKKSY